MNAAKERTITLPPPQHSTQQVRMATFLQFEIMVRIK
jgi:hypothetical protein